jgi:hypothetical protein
MSFTLTSPITGGPQTGLTSPTYTHVVDVAPDSNGKQVAVTALGGTQTGVTAHSIAAPFTLTIVKPKVYKQLGTPNPSTGVIGNVGRNTFKFIGRKGVLPLVGQPNQTMTMTLVVDVPAGSDLADPSSVRAGLSAMLGALWQQSSGLGDTLVSGIL